MFEDVFKHQKLMPDTLAGYGFAEGEGGWAYETNIMDGTFRLHVYIDNCGSMSEGFVVNPEAWQTGVLTLSDADVARLQEQADAFLAFIGE